MKLHRARLLLAACCLGACAPLAIAAAVDPNQLIKDSGQLHEAPEPEMSESELAVYDKVAPILARKPAFALKLLRAMTTSSDPDAKPSPAFEFMLGNAYYTTREYREAEVHYRRAVDRGPTFIRAWNNLGVLYFTVDRYADAVTCLSKAVTLGDRDPATFGLLGNALEKTGNTVSAEMAYNQALAAEPSNVAWSEGLLRIYMAAKQHGKAETLVRALLMNHPQDARYWATYAHLLLATGRKLDATALLERMSATGLAREADLILLGDLYAEQRMCVEAMATFARIAPAQPELAERRLLQFAKNLSSEHRWEAALTVLDTLARSPLTPPGRVSSLETRAELEIARNNWAEAKRTLEVLIAEAPANGNAWLGLGRVYLAEAEPERAIGAFERAAEISDSAYRASTELANLAFKCRDYERCLRHLERALSIRPTPAVADFRDQIKRLLPTETHSTL